MKSKKVIIMVGVCIAIFVGGFAVYAFSNQEASPMTQISIVEWTDFIKWNDRSYQGSGGWGGAYVFVPKDLIGDILGMVTDTAPTEVVGEFEAQNGMAGWRKPGTEFFSIHGYSDDDYIAVLVNGKYLLYKTPDSETPPFPDSGSWNDPLPPIVSISGIDVSEPKLITEGQIAERGLTNLFKPTDGPSVSMEIIEMGELLKIDRPDRTFDESHVIPRAEIAPVAISPIDVDGIPRYEIEPDGEFIPFLFYLPNGFSIVSTMHTGQQSIHHIASPDGLVIMNLQYVQIRFGLEQTPKAYFDQYTESELGGYPIYHTYSEGHGAFVTFEEDGILYTLSGGINGDNSMENLFILCEAIVNR